MPRPDKINRTQIPSSKPSKCVDAAKDKLKMNDRQVTRELRTDCLYIKKKEIPHLVGIMFTTAVVGSKWFQFLGGLIKSKKTLEQSKVRKTVRNQEHENDKRG